MTRRDSLPSPVDVDVPGPERDFGGYGRHGPTVAWPDGARVAVNIVINWEEGSELSIPAGDDRHETLAEQDSPMAPHERDLAVESVYEYGSRAGIWRLQRLIDEYSLKCTIFGCAVAFERVPEVSSWVKETGADVCCHGWRWDEAWRLTRDEERERMRAAVSSIERTCGARPLGWYCRYAPSASTRELVVEDGGFVYDSNAYNDDLPYFTTVGSTRHLVIPYTLVYNDVRFAMPSGYSDPAAFLDHCKRGLDYLWDEGATQPKMMSIGLHPRWIGHAGRISALKELIEHALGKGDVWFARRADIATWWLEHHEEF